MAYLIGTDEAGYGPNYGPLCVGATVWEIDDGLDPALLYGHLRRVVGNCLDRAAKKRIVWADSKVVYHGGAGIDHLERGVLAALALVDRLPNDWRSLWEMLDPRCATVAAIAGGVTQESACEPQLGESNVATSHVDDLAELPWHTDYSPPLPLWMNASDAAKWMSIEALLELADCLRSTLSDAGVRLIGVFCRAVFPREFNTMVDAGNKADALSRVTLALIADALKFIPVGSVHIFCDKHGGRNYYQVVLQTQFPDDWVQVHCESPAVSRYSFENQERKIEIGFHVSGERFLPVALASMTAKYLRETAMRPFNEFWCNRVPGLKPTAGYPGDAGRFKKQIAASQRELAIEEQLIWRCR